MLNASLKHFTCEDYEYFYEPSDDSYLLCDSLGIDLNDIKASEAKVIVEIGSGSGFVITALAKSLGPAYSYYATDINPKAIEATKATALNNNVNINVIQTHLVDELETELAGKIDILLFNPPYVPTGEDELGHDDICAAWAGGKDGIEPLKELLPKIDRLLSPIGRFYLIALRENKPSEIARYLGQFHLSSKVISKKCAGEENLLCIRFSRRNL